MPEQLRSAVLFFANGKSDKEYRLAIEESGVGYVVNYAYGRRGAKLRLGTKTPAPISLFAAKIEFNRVVAEKTGEGYQSDNSSPRIGALMRTRFGRRQGFATARVLEAELWSRNYSHSWGKAEEWATLLSEHPEVMELPEKRRVTPCWPSWRSGRRPWPQRNSRREDQRRKHRRQSAALGERLRKARVNEMPFGPPEAGVSICQLADDGLASPIKPGLYAVLVKGEICFVPETENLATARAQREVDASLMKVETDITFGTDDTFALTVRATSAPKATILTLGVATPTDGTH